jgi:hypothetical protein
MADPTLVNANITFHTNDEDKDDDKLLRSPIVSNTSTTTATRDLLTLR